MSVARLIGELRRRGIALAVDGDDLRFDGPKGALTAALREEMRQRKAELVAFVRAAQDAAADGAPIEPLAPGAPAPLAFAQQRLWFLDRLRPGDASYNFVRIHHLRGPLDAPALHAALQQLVDRHEALRTTFGGDPESPVQRSAPLSLALEVETLPAADGGGDAPVERVAGEEYARPFDLVHGPLVRARLLRCGAGHHLLVLALHHAITDGWSVGVLMRELGALYRARVRGVPAALPPLPLRYADWAAWQRRRLAGPAFEARLRGFCARLAGAPVLELVPDHRPQGAGPRGGCVAFALPPALLARVRAFAEARQATPFMTLLAAFALLLQRWTGERDVVVGCPVAGRGRPELEGLVGFFANTLPLRCDLRGEPTFDALLQRVRAAAIDAFAHEDLPFERLVAALQPERELDRNPLFRVALMLQSTPDEALDLEGLAVERVETAGASARFDLELHVLPAGGGARARFYYRADLFARATVERLAGHWLRLLDAALEDPRRPVADLPLLAPDERTRRIAAGRGSAPGDLRAASLAALWAASVEEHGGRLAVRCGEEALRYAELDARARAVAAALLAHGVRRGEAVGLCAERGIELVAGMLGIVLAGGAYVPLDPEHPPARLQLMLADAGVRVLLRARALAPRLPAFAGTALALEELAAPAAGDARAAPATGGGDLAYVIYTSGSTGAPKGVAVPHRAVSRLVLGTDYLQLGADDVVAQIANASFDAATFEVWGALLNGAELVVLPRETVLSAGRFAAALREHGITALFVTTALFHQLARSQPALFAPLRCVLFGGEAVDPACVRAVLAAGGPRRLLHVYGPTESTTFATWHEVREVAADAVTVPIGKALAHGTAHVLDARLEPVPAGVLGELYVGGDGVALGYRGDAAKTAERFVPDPFAAEPGARLYRTGDLVRAAEDGALLFVGRRDGQVKLRGFRIELGEVEAALRAHARVRDAAAALCEDDAGEKRLVAYVAHEGDAEGLAEQLRAHAAAQLPPYMVPSSIVLLDALPLTPHGKLDRRSLPAPADGARGAERIEPRGPTERAVAAIWQELLGIERVGAGESFFALGGHSLLAMRLIGRLHERLGVELPLEAVFEDGTVAGLSRRIDVLRWAHAAPAPDAPAADIEEVEL